MSKLTSVLIDANCLASKTIRDWIFLLRLLSPYGMFTIAVTEDIIAETIRAIRKANPLMEGKEIEALVSNIRNYADEIIDDYTPNPDSPVKDQGDLHVDAAANTSSVDIVVTLDKDFLNLPGDVKEKLSYDIYSPDEFLMLAADSSPQAVKEVTRSQLAYWHTKGKKLDEMLGNANCKEFASRISVYIKELAGVVVE